MKRYCQDFIKNDLKKKMVFIGGPRQVGKTFLGKSLLKENFPGGQYYSWDNDEDRLIITKKRFNPSSSLIIFDEVHKFTRWKQLIKGIYDTGPEEQTYLVTGSARLDVYKRGGDSLMGRYHYWRLHPLSIDELPHEMSKEEGLKRLLSLGGFPEPFLLGDEREAKRWRKERFDKIIKEDIRDLENIRNLDLLRLMAESLRDRVGGLINLSNISEDLQISHKTAKNWLMLLEKMFLGFTIYPLTKSIPRAILKPPKFYFFDNADTKNDPGTRLENLVATTILKRLHFIEDYYGKNCSLNYIRDKDGREVDFAVIIDGQLEELIEVKNSDKKLSSSLIYYNNLLKPKKSVQIVGDLTKHFFVNNILVTGPIDYFKDPPWLL